MKGNTAPFYTSLYTKGGEARDMIQDGKMKWTAMPIISFVQDINNRYPDLPYIFNETGLPDEFPVDIEIKLTDAADLPALNNALAVYWLKLVPAKRTREMVVIADGNNDE